MQILDTNMYGLKILDLKLHEDRRGQFVKIFNDDFFRENGLDITIKESYYSISCKDVIRGMHFQTPPAEHLKVIYVPNGSIVDVVLDIRKNSPTFGKFFSIELSSKNFKALVVPAGLAHGFKALEDMTNVTYMQTSTYDKESDMGIKYDSFGFDWECKKPIVSSRDESFLNFEQLDTPFVFKGSA